LGKTVYDKNDRLVGVDNEIDWFIRKI
jgi:hypothetical protein